MFYSSALSCLQVIILLPLKAASRDNVLMNNGIIFVLLHIDGSSQWSTHATWKIKSRLYWSQERTSSNGINKLQVMQYAARRTATGCTQDTSIQHMHDAWWSCWPDGEISWLVDQRRDDRAPPTNKGQGSG